MLGASGLALGSYAFQWGHKMEGTPTWFGLFLDDGAPVATVDTMTELWSGMLPAHRAPAVEPLRVIGGDVRNPGDEVRVEVAVAGSDNGPLRVRWALRTESREYTTGGDFRPPLPDIEGAILDGDETGARIRMPEEPGAYRLFFYAYEQGGKAATANVPLLVQGNARTLAK